MSLTSEMERISSALDAVEAGKMAISQAITSKGVPTEDDASFDTMAVNVGLIEGGGGGESDIVVLDFPSFVNSEVVLCKLNSAQIQMVEDNEFSCALCLMSAVDVRQVQVAYCVNNIVMTGRTDNDLVRTYAYSGAATKTNSIVNKISQSLYVTEGELRFLANNNSRLYGTYYLVMKK